MWRLHLTSKLYLPGGAKCLDRYDIINNEKSLIVCKYQVMAITSWQTISHRVPSPHPPTPQLRHSLLAVLVKQQVIFTQVDAAKTDLLWWEATQQLVHVRGSLVCLNTLLRLERQRICSILSNFPKETIIDELRVVINYKW